MICPNCGKEVAADKKFCGHCGSALQPPGISREVDAGIKPEPSGNESGNVESKNIHEIAETLKPTDGETQPLSPPQFLPEPPSPDYGKQESQLEIHQLTCPQCGYSNPIEAKFCNQCGGNFTPPKPSTATQKFKEASQEAAAPQQQNTTSERKKTGRTGRFFIALPVVILGWGLSGWGAHAYRLIMLNQFLAIPALWRNIMIVGALIFSFFGSLSVLLSLRILAVRMRFVSRLLIFLGWLLAGSLMSLDAILYDPLLGNYIWKIIGLILGGVITGVILWINITEIKFLHMLFIWLGWTLGAFPSVILAAPRTVHQFYTEIGTQAGYQLIPYTFTNDSGLLLGLICGGLTLLIAFIALRKKPIRNK